MTARMRLAMRLLRQTRHVMLGEALATAVPLNARAGGGNPRPSRRWMTSPSSAAATSAQCHLTDAQGPRRQRVIAFLSAAAEAGLFLSVLTLGELRKGGVAAKRRTDAGAADHLGAWVEGIETTFADRILRSATASPWSPATPAMSRGCLLTDYN
jgi:hypothetical protein